MNNYEKVCAALMIAFLALSAFAADEPPDDTIVDDLRARMAEKGFDEYYPGDIRTPEEEKEWIRGLLETEQLIVSERLSRGNTLFVGIKKKVNGQDVWTYSEIEKALVPGPDGSVGDPRYFAREVSYTETQSRLSDAMLASDGFNASEFAAGLEVGAAGSLLIGTAMEGAVGRAFSNIGQPSPLEGMRQMEATKSVLDGSCIQDERERIELRETLGADLDETAQAPPIWASPSPAVMMAGNACFLQFAADSFRAAASMGEEAKKAAAEAYADFIERALEDMHYIGKEPVEGHVSYGVGVDDLKLASVADNGDQMEVNRLELWIDAETFVRRKVTLAGVMTSGRKSQDFVMDRIFDEYRNVPNSALYEPYLEILRFGGLMTPEQQKELEDAEKELEDYESQLAELPQSQQQMMRTMMEPQIERLRGLVRGNAFEFETVTTEIRVGPDFESVVESPFTRAPAAASGASATLDDQAAQVVRIVQIHLNTLGYSPGNTNGEMDRATVVAIVKFQSAEGLEVTGEATPQLAGILAARVDAQ